MASQPTPINECHCAVCNVPILDNHEICASCLQDVKNLRDARAWLKEEHCGASSVGLMCTLLLESGWFAHEFCPYDESDLQRCCGALEAIPGLARPEYLLKLAKFLNDAFHRKDSSPSESYYLPKWSHATIELVKRGALGGPLAKEAEAEATTPFANDSSENHSQKTEVPKKDEQVAAPKVNLNSIISGEPVETHAIFSTTAGCEGILGIVHDRETAYAVLKEHSAKEEECPGLISAEEKEPIHIKVLQHFMEDFLAYQQLTDIRTSSNGRRIVLLNSGQTMLLHEKDCAIRHCYFTSRLLDGTLIYRTDDGDRRGYDTFIIPNHLIGEKRFWVVRYGLGAAFYHIPMSPPKKTCTVALC